MKIRNGFVSNSSSSSFLVFFPEKISQKEQLKKYLNLGIQEKLYKSYQRFVNEAMKPIDFDSWAMSVIFKEIQEQGENNLLNCLGNFDTDIWYNGEKIEIGTFTLNNNDDIYNMIDSYDKLEMQMDNFDWSQENSENLFRELEDEKYDLQSLYFICQKLLTEIKKHDSDIFYSFVFSDESGDYYSRLEHDNIFNVPFYKQSNH